MNDPDLAKLIEEGKGGVVVAWVDRDSDKVGLRFEGAVRPIDLYRVVGLIATAAYEIDSVARKATDVSALSLEEFIARTCKESREAGKTTGGINVRTRRSI